jgi:F-type H+-transporting ATPase subunit c
MTRFTAGWTLSMVAAGWLTLGLASSAAAQDETHAAAQTADQARFLLFDSKGAAYFAASIGAGLVVIGGARGISRIGGGAVESMARQPEASGNINVAMIITAAMIEGATLFAVVVCLLGLLLK